MLSAILFIGMAHAAGPGPSAHDVYCSKLAARNTEAEMFRADTDNQNAQWKALSQLQAALLKHIEEEALEKKMSWDDYRALTRKRSKEMGQEIKLTEFLRAQYVSDLFARYCVPMEAGVGAAKGTPREGQPTELFQPFEVKGMPEFKAFKTQLPNSSK
jgi:hypothetical protein